MSDNFAVYLAESLSQQKISTEICNFIEILLQAPIEKKEEIDESSQLLTEFVYEALETACGVKVSMEGSLDNVFVINCLTLASSLKGQNNLGMDSKNTRFIQFVKEVLLQQSMQTEDAKLLVLDSLCSLCQNL